MSILTSPIEKMFEVSISFLNTIVVASLIQSNEPTVRVANLTPDTEYIVHATILNDNREFNVPHNDGHTMKTLLPNMRPENVTHVWFGEFLPNLDNAKRLDVEVLWNSEIGE